MNGQTMFKIGDNVRIKPVFGDEPWFDGKSFVIRGIREFVWFGPFRSTIVFLKDFPNGFTSECLDVVASDN